MIRSEWFESSSIAEDSLYPPTLLRLLGDTLLAMPISVDAIRVLSRLSADPNGIHVSNITHKNRRISDIPIDSV